MAAGCLIVGSRTPPVEEVIRDGVNGFLVDFHSPKEIAEKTAEVVEAGASLDHIRQRARKTVLDRFALNKCLPRQLKLIRDLAGRG
jgi:glycosyltransferase involved in cell wall biosynthesis